MKGLRLAALLMGMLVLAMLPVPNARADAGLESLNVTNIWKANATITAYPTNASGWYTGAGVSLRNQLVGCPGILIQGALNTDATNWIDIRFIRAAASGPPTISTNGGVGVPPNTQFVANDWEVNQFWKITVPFWSTNATTIITNFPELWIGPATDVGVWDIVNSNASVGNITNATIKIIKKIQPIRYP